MLIEVKDVKLAEKLIEEGKATYSVYTSLIEDNLEYVEKDILSEIHMNEEDSEDFFEDLVERVYENLDIDSEIQDQLLSMAREMAEEYDYEKDFIEEEIERLRELEDEVFESVSELTEEIYGCIVESGCQVDIWRSDNEYNVLCVSSDEIDIIHYVEYEKEDGEVRVTEVRDY